MSAPPLPKPKKLLDQLRDANLTKNDFQTLSAVLAGKAEFKEVIDKALECCRLYQKKIILFVKGSSRNT